MSLLAPYPFTHFMSEASSHPKELSREKVSYIEPVFHKGIKFMCYERLAP